MEGNPTEAQKSRLQDFLVELMLLCRQYNLLLDTYDADTRVIDLGTNTIVGIGLDYIVLEVDGEQIITNYECDGSILDGVWLVDTDSGPREQRELGRAHPRREP